MKRKLFLAAAIAALSLGAAAAHAQPGNAGSMALEPDGMAAQEAGMKFYFGFGYPYYYQPYYYGSPYYYAPYPKYYGPYQYCHLGVCY